MDDLDVVSQMLDRQPTRRGKHRPPRRFDKTQLHAHQHGRQVHRDYAAHFFRWGWVARQIKAGMKILDVGCGQDLPLLWVLSGKLQTVPSAYVGVDLNRIEDKPNVAWATIRDEFDFVNADLGVAQLAEFDVAVCLEVIEHMAVADGKRLLDQLLWCLKPGGSLYLSTPVFDGKAAVNHVHEYTIPELKALVELCGFRVDNRWGTFGNVRDLQQVFDDHEREVFHRLSFYYSHDVLSCMFAPEHPDHSRNNLWLLRRPS